MKNHTSFLSIILAGFTLSAVPQTKAFESWQKVGFAVVGATAAVAGLKFVTSYLGTKKTPETTTHIKQEENQGEWAVIKSTSVQPSNQIDDEAFYSKELTLIANISSNNMSSFSPEILEELASCINYSYPSFESYLKHLMLTAEDKPKDHPLVNLYWYLKEHRSFFEVNIFVKSARAQHHLWTNIEELETVKELLNGLLLNTNKRYENTLCIKEARTFYNSLCTEIEIKRGYEL